jgi:signal transduction histidine kinase
MRKKGLVYKTVTTFTTVIVMSFLIVAIILSIWFERYYFDQRRRQMDKQADLIREARSKGRDNKQLEEIMLFVGEYVDADILLVDTIGFVFAVSNPEHKSLTYKAFLREDITKLRAGKSVEKRSAYHDMFQEPVHIYMLPIQINGVFNAGIVMYTPEKRIKEPLKQVYTVIWASSLAAVVFASFIISYFSKRLIIRPLAKINAAARKISRGEVERRVTVKASDEISELAESFNTMADSLEKVETVRREFISNVSHELRTPITSIKGFIGGILDGVIPRDKENYYLSIAYEEIQRLTRLISDLLDLSAIEAGKFSLRMSEVDINEVIKLCVINFETKINQKKLKVEVLLEDQHLYVAGDRDRLIQVVTNLLDNAIKYVYDEGSVKINTRTKGEKILVSVYNNGPHIPAEDAKSIWDRFYKLDKSRTSKVSTGLGLPIVRNILTQHGEDIWVESKEREGVTFTFTLKKA